MPNTDSRNIWRRFIQQIQTSEHKNVYFMQIFYAVLLLEYLLKATTQNKCRTLLKHPFLSRRKRKLVIQQQPGPNRGRGGTGDGITAEEKPSSLPSSKFTRCRFGELRHGLNSNSNALGWLLHYQGDTKKAQEAGFHLYYFAESF